MKASFSQYYSRFIFLIVLVHILSLLYFKITNIILYVVLNLIVLGWVITIITDKKLRFINESLTLKLIFILIYILHTSVTILLLCHYN